MLCVAASASVARCRFHFIRPALCSVHGWPVCLWRAKCRFESGCRRHVVLGHLHANWCWSNETCISEKVLQLRYRWQRPFYKRNRQNDFCYLLRVCAIFMEFCRDIRQWARLWASRGRNERSLFNCTTRTFPMLKACFTSEKVVMLAFLHILALFLLFAFFCYFFILFAAYVVVVSYDPICCAFGALDVFTIMRFQLGWLACMRMCAECWSRMVWCFSVSNRLIARFGR